MASSPVNAAARLAHERNVDRRARRDAARRNAERGIGRNLEEAIRLVRTAEALREAFRPSR
jgi:hypothetical protein